jgi:membrane protease subunit HflC
MNRLIAAGIAVIVILYLLWSSIYIVDPTEQAIVTRFGRITTVRTQPGLYFKLPTSLVDDVQIIDNRLQRFDLDNRTLQVRDGKFYVVDAFVTYRIADARKFRERALGSLDIVEQRLQTRFDAALREVYGLRDFQAALSAERSDMMQQARDLIKPGMTDLGIDIVDVRILRTDLTDQVSAQTYDRMKAERLAQAALLRANGQQAAQSIRAIADRQAIEIVADATKDSEILRGEGDGLRSEIYAKAYNADPDFYAFYRSLQAYETGLSGAGTTMVLAPDSSFFKYFGDPGKATVPAGPLAPETPAPSVAPVPDVIPPTDENTPEPPISGIAPKSTTAAPAAQPAPSPATAPTPSPAVAPATPAPSTAAPATAAPVGTTPTP